MKLTMNPYSALMPMMMVKRKMLKHAYVLNLLFNTGFPIDKRHALQEGTNK